MKIKIALTFTVIGLAISIIMNVYNVFGAHRLEIHYQENGITVVLGSQWYYVDKYEENDDFISVEF